MTDPAGDLPSLHVGDHVLDRDEEDAATLVVTGLPLQRAASYDVGEKTVADYNPGYPDEDHVIEAVYPDRTDVSLDEQQTYAFPRSRLRLETPVHDRDDEDGETVEIPAWAAVEARDELDRLIDETEGDEPDPLTDRTFQTRDALADTLEDTR